MGFTFSILDSWSVSLKLGAGANPLLHTNIFLSRKDNDLFPMFFFPWSVQTSLHLPRITLMVLSISSSLSSESLHNVAEILLSTSKLDGQLRNLSNGSSAISFSTLEAGFLDNSFVSSFCNFPISSGVKSSNSSDEDGSSWWGGFWLSGFSFRSLFPKVPIASNPWGQSLNSSLMGSCFVRSTQWEKNTRMNGIFY